MALSLLNQANQVVRQYQDYPDVDMRYNNKAAFIAAIAANPSRIPDGWQAYCFVEKQWFQADQTAKTAKAIAADIVPASATQAGTMSAADFQKLAAIAAGATANAAANTAETIAGTDNAKFVTSFNLAAWWSDAKTRVQAWTNNHNFTGLLQKSGVNVATVDDVNTRQPKEDGKGLSTNDLTNARATKLDGVATGATANAAANTAETIAGTDNAKFVTAFNLAAWWTDVKTRVQTWSNNHNFTGLLQRNGVNVATTDDLAPLLTQSGSKQRVALSGSANVQIGNATPAITTLTDGLALNVKPATTNTGAATLSINGLGAKAITLNGAALIGNELVAGQYNVVIYDIASDSWQLQGVASVGANKLNAGDNTGLAGDEGGVALLSATGKVIRNAYLRFLNATRELVIGVNGIPGKLTIWGNVFKIYIQDNIGDGQAYFVMNNLQDKALQFVDKAGNVYMMFRTLATGAGVVISKLWIFDQNVSMPLYRAQAAATSNGAGVKVYGTKGDVASTQFVIPMATDTLVCAVNFRLKMIDATGNRIIHATWAGTFKRISGTISFTGTAVTTTLSDYGMSGFAFGAEPKSDNTGIVFYFTPGGMDSTAYTGGFYNIEYCF
jgi:hypothetical protein